MRFALHTSPFRTCALAVATATVLVTPLAANEPSDDILRNVIPTDAVRIEVAPDRLQDCAGLVAWAFELPSASAGFGEPLPEVPVGYGPTCAVIPVHAQGLYQQLARP